MAYRVAIKIIEISTFTIGVRFPRFLAVPSRANDKYFPKDFRIFDAFFQDLHALKLRPDDN